MKILRTGILLILLSVLLVLAGGALAGPTGMKIALGFAVVMNAISLFFLGQDCADVERSAAGNARAVAAALRGDGAPGGQGEFAGAETVRNSRSGAECVCDRPKSARHASVAVTQGLLELMNDDELEGVIAHELSHVRNYDILTSSIAATSPAPLPIWRPWPNGE